jgi:hypothetical protein
MNEDEINRLVEKAQTKDTLQQMFNITLEDRISRWVDVRPPNIIANSHFAAVSMECYYLYRDGHFYGAISLAQSVAEALTRFLCEKNGLEVDESYWKNLKNLKRHGINTALIALFKAIREGRNDYHHLNPTIETDKEQLAALAKARLTNLKDIEADIFTYDVNDGKIAPLNPQYWDAGESDGTLAVYLRID